MTASTTWLAIWTSGSTTQTVASWAAFTPERRRRDAIRSSRSTRRPTSTTAWAHAAAASRGPDPRLEKLGRRLPPGLVWTPMSRWLNRAAPLLTLLLPLACAHPAERAIEGRWRGTSVENFDEGQVAAATG